jgi:hypothetical protein
MHISVVVAAVVVQRVVVEVVADLTEAAAVVAVIKH